MATFNIGIQAARNFCNINAIELNRVDVTKNQFSNAAIDAAYRHYKTEKAQQEFIKGWVSIEDEYIFNPEPEAIAEALRGAWANLAEAALWEAIAKRADEDDVDNAIELAYIRANAKQETVIVFRTAKGLFARTPAEMARYNLNDSPVIIRTVVPAPGPEEAEAATYDRDVRETRAAFEREQAANEAEETEPEGSDNPDGEYWIVDHPLLHDYEQEVLDADKLLVNGVMYAPEDITVRNAPELPETVYVRFLSDDSGVFVTRGEDGYNALKDLADAADVEAARVKLHSGETLTDAELDVLYDAPESGEDSAAARAGRKVIHAATKGETVIYEDSETRTIRKAEYAEYSNEAGSWLRTPDGLTFIPYDQIMGVEKAPADLPRPEPEANLNLKLERDAARFLTHYEKYPIYVVPSGLDDRRADLARRRAELEAEEQRLNAEQALADIVAALNPSNEFYIFSLTLKCRTCYAPWLIMLDPDSTPVDIAKLLRKSATAECEECAHNRETFGEEGEEQEDDGSIGGADEYGARGPFNLDGQRADEIEGLAEEGLDPLTAAQELEDFADDGDRPPFLDQFNHEEDPF